MDTAQKAIILTAIAVALLVILIPRSLQFRSYSDRDIYDTCLEIHLQCEELAARKATQVEWKQLEEDSLPKLEALANDIELYLNKAKPESQVLYQVAKHELPKAVQRQKARDVGESLAMALRLIEAPKQQAKRKPATRGEPAAWDPVIVGLLIFDSVVVVGGLAYYLRTKHWN